METSSDTCPPVTPSGHLSAELARELKQDWPPARYGKWIDGDGSLAQFVNQVNKTVSLGLRLATLPGHSRGNHHETAEEPHSHRAREVATNLLFRSP